MVRYHTIRVYQLKSFVRESVEVQYRSKSGVVWMVLVVRTRRDLHAPSQSQQNAQVLFVRVVEAVKAVSHNSFSYPRTMGALVPYLAGPHTIRLRQDPTAGARGREPRA